MNYDNRILFQAIKGFKLRMYCGQFMLWATMTVSWLAIPARKTSAFVVVWFLDFLPATHMLIFRWSMARSTMVLIL